MSFLYLLRTSVEYTCSGETAGLKSVGIFKVDIISLFHFDNLLKVVGFFF
jgi:hypothetical protein